MCSIARKRKGAGTTSAGASQHKSKWPANFTHTLRSKFKQKKGQPKQPWTTYIHIFTLSFQIATSRIISRFAGFFFLLFILKYYLITQRL